MMMYVDALVKGKNLYYAKKTVTQVQKNDLIANYKAKGALQATANMWLRNQIAIL
jgi:hypothetical protein